jgi:hypothetical protein
MLFTLALALAAGDGFEGRVQAAKALERKADGKAWQSAMWDRVGDPATDALKDCIASNAPADKRPFTLVADVDADGRSSQVEVRPATPVARCFAGQFNAWMLPAPPKTPAPYPVEIDVTMDP